MKIWILRVYLTLGIMYLRNKINNLLQNRHHLNNFLKDISEEKKPDDPTEYEDDEDIDYALDDVDMSNQILEDIGIENYESVENTLKQDTMKLKKSKAYLRKVISDATKKKK